MTHPNTKVFSFEIPVNDPETMKKLQSAMDDYYDGMDKYLDDLAKELGVSKGVACDIWYLRSRSRWTQEMENKIIQAYKDGKPIDSGAILSGEWRG